MFDHRRRNKIERTRNRLRVFVAAVFVLLLCFSILIYRLWVLPGLSVIKAYPSVPIYISLSADCAEAW